MADINSFVFTGRLTKDAEFRTLASGKGLLIANVACNTGYGEYKKVTYLKVQQWGESGAKIVGYLTKGTLVGGTGELSLNTWTSKEGKEYNDIQVDVRSINMLSSGNKKPDAAEPADLQKEFPDSVSF